MNKSIFRVQVELNFEFSRLIESTGVTDLLVGCRTSEVWILNRIEPK